MDSDFQSKSLEKSDKEALFGESDDLRVGMEVSDESEAYQLCNTYAFNKGFSIRKGHLRRDSQNKVRQREFLCSKEGFQVDEDLCEAKKVRRLDTRTGCKAVIRFTVENGMWKLSYINPVHNHEFAKPEERQFLRSGRNIPSVRANILGSKSDGSIRPAKSHSYLGKEFGSDENDGSTNKDLPNCLQRSKDEMIEQNGQSLINYFKHKQMEDPNFFYSVQVDQFSRITNYFWRDGRSKLDYDCFGDIPKTIFTDEDKAMEKAKAIETVFPETRHRLCNWQISKNATQHLASHCADPEFKKHFNKCVLDCFTEVEFQNSWDDMIKMFNLESNSWLKMLYSFREKWCPAFSLDTFSANIGSSQRGENTNTIFHQVSRKTVDLVCFVQHYEQKTKKMRFTELEEDFRCKNAMPHLRVNSGIFKHAATEYTVKMYSFFENELMSIFGVRMVEVGNDGNQYIYEAIEEGLQRVYMIQYNSTTSMISCSCKLFESMGLLCRHALKVLDFKNYTSIPTQYIVKRWTKGAKKGIVVSNEFCKSSYRKAKSAQSLRLSELMHEGNNVFSIGSLCDSGTRIVRQKLAETIKLLESDEETTNMLGSLSKVDDQSVCDVLLDNGSVESPSCDG
ncbi:unnamed protein product [Prunus armeniaca]|uniref:SWIM-type domain-containing protein n=1 Tax=Prunus armeniaca TaxID=36596 RepID=A0A6J5VIP1_PRUAR|nr:unnamed protein product [Prunus armeniaca]